MILGTYWYFEFPTGLYAFDYFEFRKGYGGHGDNPAELVTKVVTADPDKIISGLRLLVETYDEGFLSIYRDGNKLQIATGAYQLFDYDFLLMAEVENVLKTEGAALTGEKLDNPIHIRLYKDDPSKEIVYPEKRFLKVVGSALKMHNAENIKFRLDCNVKLAEKDKFITELKAIAIAENMTVFFYYDLAFDDTANLMLFFTNGRQGLNRQGKQFINTLRFESKVEEAVLKCKATFGHVGGFDRYPKDGPKIEMMLEKEYII